MEIHRQTKPGVSYFQPAVKTRPKDIPVYLALPGTERERERILCPGRMQRGGSRVRRIERENETRN